MEGVISLTNVGNYRPSSRSSSVGNLIERCVYQHLYNHLHVYILIHPKQSGFLKGHSTIHQLLDISHDIVSAIDSIDVYEFLRYF